MQGSKISTEIFRRIFFQIIDVEKSNSEKNCEETHVK